jgi:hypothetical protein
MTLYYDVLILFTYSQGRSNHAILHYFGVNFLIFLIIFKSQKGLNYTTLHYIGYFIFIHLFTGGSNHAALHYFGLVIFYFLITRGIELYNLALRWFFFIKKIFL